MKITQSEIPVNYWYRDADRNKPIPSDTPCDIDILTDDIADEAWYWYIDNGYDGSGGILLRQDDKYAIMDIGHCSCNTPLQGLESSLVWHDAASLSKTMSVGLQDQFEPLFKLAGI